MNSIETIPTVEALGWTLVHFLWQGALVALMLALARVALKRRTANLRYLVSCGAMLLMLALPVITFVTLSSIAHKTQVVMTDPPAPPKQTVKTDSLRSELGDDSLIVGGLSQSPTPTSPMWKLRELFSGVAPWLTSLWLAGVILLSLRMIFGWVYSRRLRSYGTGPLPEEWQVRFAELCRNIRVLRPVRLLESAVIQVPAVIGWLRPVVLIPASALVGLPPRQLEAVIAHELAHIRRYDYLVNLLQTAVEILLFYHPAVWWVSREIRQEREHCCDDVAVEVCGDALIYARALIEIETLRDSGLRLAMAADGGSLLSRIQRIVGSSPRSSEQTASWVAGAIVFAIVFVSVAGAQLITPNTQANESAAMKTQSRSAADYTPAAHPRGVPSREEKSSGKEAVKSVAVDESKDLADEAPAIEPPQSQGAGSGFIEGMTALGYTNLSVDDLIALKSNGVTPQLVRELKAQGYDKLTVKQLLRLASNGVSPQFIKELKGAGLEQAPIESLIRLQTHGVSPKFIKELSELGYKNLSADQLSRVASHGVTPQFIQGLQSAGYRDLAIDEVVRARDHGVDAEFIKVIRDQGYDGLTMDQVIRTHDHGVDTEFTREMNSAGFGRLPLELIVRARDHGVDPEFIRKFRSAGYSNVPLDQIIRSKDHGVTLDYIESISKAGYDNVPLDQLVRMKDHGVDAEFIRRAKSHGFQNLSLDQLIRLRDAGVLQ
jgi:beta-lactamase regulating signal transducer with metallopeptidase domain